MLFCPLSVLSGVSSLTCNEGEHVVLSCFLFEWSQQSHMHWRRTCCFVLFPCWVESAVSHALKGNMLFCPLSLLSGVSSRRDGYGTVIVACIEGEHVVFVLSVCWAGSVVNGMARVLLLSLHLLKRECRFCLLCLLSRVSGRWDGTEFCYYCYMYYKGNVGFVFFVCWAGSVVDGTAGVVLLPLHVLQRKCRFCLLCLLSRVSSRSDGTSIVTTVTYIKRETSVLSSLFADQG